MDNESYQKYLKIKEEVTKQSYKILLEAWCFIPVFKEVYHTFKNFQIFQVNILMYGWQHNEHKMKPDRKYLLGIKEIKDFYPAPIKIKKPRLIKVVFNSWQIAHFRLLGDDRRLPYGTSVLEKARRIWKQLILSEDSMPQGYFLE